MWVEKRTCCYCILGLECLYVMSLVAGTVFTLAYLGVCIVLRMECYE